MTTIYYFSNNSTSLYKIMASIPYERVTLKKTSMYAFNHGFNDLVVDFVYKYVLKVERSTNILPDLPNDIEPRSVDMML